jgi:hypothetical protein
MEVVEQSPSRRLGALALVTGLLCVVLFGAALAWAHHWNVLTVSIVVAWALAMLAAPVVAIVAHRAGSAPALANRGIAFNVLAWFALGFVGLLLSLGADVPSCGGG